jgi:hypothetical protein
MFGVRDPLKQLDFIYRHYPSPILPEKNEEDEDVR